MDDDYRTKRAACKDKAMTNVTTDPSCVDSTLAASAPRASRFVSVTKVAACFAAAFAATVALGCSRDNVAHAAPAQAEAVEVSNPVAANAGREPTAPPVADDQPWDVKTEVKGDCKAGAECTAVITIAAKGEFHVNKDYPFKFTATGNGAGPVEFHGSSGNVFTGSDFARAEKSGTMTIKFKPVAKGKVTISGPYKICICSEKVCQPTTTQVSFDVDVK